MTKDPCLEIHARYAKKDTKDYLVEMIKGWRSFPKSATSEYQKDVQLIYLKEYLKRI